ncbi:MAG: hypothetical protein ACPGVH_07890 [Chitinophagales bacterium]
MDFIVQNKIKSILKRYAILLLLIVGCKKQNCEPIKEPLKQYFINEIFEMKYNEVVIVKDTTLHIQADSFLTYSVNILSIVEDKRTPTYLCSQTIGGFIYSNIYVKNNYSNLSKNDTLFYPSCTDNYISEFSAYYKPLLIDSLELWLLQVIPQPDEIDDEDNTLIPIEDYRFRLKLKNND